MQYFGFDRPSFAFKTYGFGSTTPAAIPVAANFVTGAYTKNGAASTFDDTFGFKRDSVAWLYKDSVITEYAKNTPRFNKGLLIEQEATNYAKWSFLPQDGIYTSGTVYYNASSLPNGWRKAGSAGGYLYPAAIPTSKPCIMSCLYVGAYAFNQLVVDNVRATASKLAGTDYYYTLLPSGVTDRNYGFIWPEDSTATRSSTVVCWQIEEGTRITSPIKTTTEPVTRLADVLSLKSNATSVTGDWDSTLSLSIVDGQLTHTGYGYIRSLMIT